MSETIEFKSFAGGEFPFLVCDCFVLIASFERNVSCVFVRFEGRFRKARHSRR